MGCPQQEAALCPGAASLGRHGLLRPAHRGSSGHLKTPGPQTSANTCPSPSPSGKGFAFLLKYSKWTGFFFPAAKIQTPQGKSMNFWGLLQSDEWPWTEPQGCWLAATQAYTCHLATPGSVSSHGKRRVAAECNAQKTLETLVQRRHSLNDNLSPYHLPPDPTHFTSKSLLPGSLPLGKTKLFLVLPKDKSSTANQIHSEILLCTHKNG